MAAGRHIVHESLVDEYVAKLAEKARNQKLKPEELEALERAIDQARERVRGHDGRTNG